MNLQICTTTTTLFLILELLPFFLLSQQVNASQILIYTAAIYPSELNVSHAVERVTENRRRYCERHANVHFLIDTVGAFGGMVEVDPKWGKIYQAHHLLKDYDWIWLLDADALIMNASISLHNLIGNVVETFDHQIDIIISRDYNNFNTGSFMLRQSDWTELLLKEWLLRKDTVIDYNNWMEQSGLISMIEDNSLNMNEHMATVPQRLINSYTNLRACNGKRTPTCEYQRGDFVVHAANAGLKGLSLYLKTNGYVEV